MTIKISSYSMRFQLAIPAEKYLSYYKGKAQSIQALSLDNKKIRFPANALRPHLTHEGIYGLFEIQFDKNNKLINVNKLD